MRGLIALNVPPPGSHGDASVPAESAPQQRGNRGPAREGCRECACPRGVGARGRGKCAGEAQRVLRERAVGELGTRRAREGDPGARA